MARSNRSSERRATLLDRVGTRGHEMTKRQRANRNRPKTSTYVVNIRHLQNGLGVAGVLGIVLIFAYLALDAVSPGAPSAVTSGPATPLTPTGASALPSDVPSALLPNLAPSSVST